MGLGGVRCGEESGDRPPLGRWELPSDQARRPCLAMRRALALLAVALLVISAVALGPAGWMPAVAARAPILTAPVVGAETHVETKLESGSFLGASSTLNRGPPALPSSSVPKHSEGGQIVRRRKLAVALVYLTLELGALIGVPVRLDQIEEMARLLNRTLATEVQRRNDDGDPPPEPDGE